MATSTIILIVVIALAFIWGNCVGGKLPAPFGSRACQGKIWRLSFPDASKEEIREFLSIFTDSFAFNAIYKLKLNPHDQLLDIYRALYPHKWQADALEFETLADTLESKYSINFGSVWRDGLTLGQLFITVRQSPNWIPISRLHDKAVFVRRS